MNNFDKTEKEGRNLFKTILLLCLIIDYKESTDKFDTLDMYYNIAYNKVGVEIKKRDKKYEIFPTYVMDYSKYSILKLRLKNKEFTHILYVNFFGDDTVYIFSFKKIVEGVDSGTILVRENFANKTTAEKSKKINKYQVFIPKLLAVRFIRSNGKWTKQ